MDGFLKKDMKIESIIDLILNPQISMPRDFKKNFKNYINDS